MAFSPTDAAFEGFRIARERPKAVGLWAGLALVVNVITAVVMISAFGPQLSQFLAAALKPSPDPAQAMALLSSLAPMAAVFLPITLVSGAIFSAAIYRVVLRPQDSAFGYLRLGADELRLIVLKLVLMVLAFVASFVVTMAATLLIALVTMATGGSTGNPGFAAGFTGFLSFIGIVCVSIWAAVRLSLAGPLTLADRKLRLFESWAATKGHFWALFSSYFLAGIMALLVGLLAMVVLSALIVVAAGGSQNVAAPEFGSLAGYFTVPRLVDTLGTAVLTALFYAIVLSPAAVACRDLSGRKDEAVF
jgi:uncharacterized integral membrane protein